MHISRLWNDVDGCFNALPKGRDVACNWFPRNRSTAMYSLGHSEDPYWFLRVWVDILCIVCKWGFLKVLTRVHWNTSDKECGYKCTSHGYGGCEVVVGYPYLIHSLRMWMDMDCLRVGMGFTIHSLMVTMRIPLKSFRVGMEVPSTCSG